MIQKADDQLIARYGQFLCAVITTMGGVYELSVAHSRFPPD
ncbi:MAG: hypothetical protein GFH27_549283n208 [Chloroflexi bacterium AL-W]|nr:hypothetical protein [Chloroflexi bacterium AL-N1]NOK64671.1 hypothetical protein [Chloroflexi bacterium AL-N10]NOK75912.1 hypothetical protein [Chloroflexi bacterium AL-N5]NOK80329.1 hypothetical protein [Chloroflexi bacterium AL-W]NOK86842.1 hypothetical protein [Chloroflexi bacterium AL-N15]